MADIDRNLDEIAADVLTRLKAIPEDRAVIEPHNTLMELAAPLMASLAHERALPAEDLQPVINELPELTRQILGMFVDRDLSYRQIAEELGIPPTMALSLLAKAYAYLRKRLPARTLDGLSPGSTKKVRFGAPKHLRQ